MSADSENPGAADEIQADTNARYVDAREASMVQVGDGNALYIYNYGTGATWTDRIAPSPLVSRSGQIDSPYRGLNFFEERDQALFFGRQTSSAEIVKRISDCMDGTGLLIVSGASGVGKSSLLRAGVLPAMRRTGLASEAASWPCLMFTPKHAPLDELAVRVAMMAGVDSATVRRGLEEDPAGFALTARQAALAATSGDRRESAPEPRLLIVIDQFEQLFVECSDEDHRRAFITALHAATSKNRGIHQPAAMALLIVRADFEATCADYPLLSDAVQDRYLVKPMTDPELRMAITEPVKAAGSTIDHDLTEVLLEEIATRKGAVPGTKPGEGYVSRTGVLPLLSHALDQAWRHRIGESLTLADYERTGGLEGAVASSAEKAYGQLTSAQKVVARHVFTRLTATAADGTDVTIRVVRSDLAAGGIAADRDDLTTVLEAFAAARLLTLATDTVEISHEAVLTAWPLLHDEWLAETYTDRLVRTRLYNTAAEWERKGRDSSYLYSGSLLQTATATADRMTADSVRYPPLDRLERDFLRESGRLARRKVRRRQSVTGLLVALVIGLAVVLFYASSSRQEAIRQRDAAASGQLIQESESLGESNPRISDLEAVAAWRIHPSDQALYAMRAAASRPSIAAINTNAGGIWSLAFSPNGKFLATGNENGTARLWNVASQHAIGAPLSTYGGGNVYSVAFSPSGKILAGGNDKGIVRLWDVPSGFPVGHPLSNGRTSVQSVAFSPNGKILAAGCDNGKVRLWDIDTDRVIGRPIVGYTRSVKGSARSVGSVAFSPRGKLLAVAASDTTRLWDVTTGQFIGRPMTQTGAITSVTFSPNGKILAIGDTNGIVRKWGVASQELLGGQVFADSEPVSTVKFSHDGSTIAVGSFDGSARLWNAANGQLIGEPFNGSSAPIESVSFSPNGETLATGGTDGVIRLWDVTMYLPAAILTAFIGPIWSVALSPNGKLLVIGGNKVAQLWDLATHRLIGGSLKCGTGAVMSVAFSPNGKIVATADSDGTTRLWDASTGREVDHTLPSHSTLWSVAFSPNGKLLAVGTGKDTQLWDIGTSKPFVERSLSYSQASVAFSPSGKMLATTNLGTQLWNVATGKPIGHLLASGEKDAISGVFSPDGKILAVAGGTGVQLWNVTTRKEIGGLLPSAFGPVQSVAFSPDGKTLVAGGFEDTARFWDVATEGPLGGPLTADSKFGDVDSVVFSPNGKGVVTGDGDGLTRFWTVSYLNHAPQRLCALAKRPFSRAEWKRYVPAGPVYQDVCHKN